MGLFEFIKDLLLPKHDETLTEEKIQALLVYEVKKAGILIQNFQLQFSNGLATLSGIAATAKDPELTRSSLAIIGL